MFADYETLETHLGNHLRRADNYDMNEDLFFPIQFLDRLFHFAEDLSVVENRRNPEVEVLHFGRDFDIWIDDMVANAVIYLADENTVAPMEVKLIDVQSFRVNASGNIIATTDDGEFIVIGNDGEPISVTKIEDLCLNIETVKSFDEEERPETLEYLASIFIRAAQSMKTEVSNKTTHKFVNPIYEYFKYDLAKLVPALMDDLMLISENKMLKLTLSV